MANHDNLGFDSLSVEEQCRLLKEKGMEADDLMKFKEAADKLLPLCIGDNFNQEYHKIDMSPAGISLLETIITSFQKELITEPEFRPDFIPVEVDQDSDPEPVFGQSDD